MKARINGTQKTAGKAVALILAAAWTAWMPPAIAQSQAPADGGVRKPDAATTDIRTSQGSESVTVQGDVSTTVTVDKESRSTTVAPNVRQTDNGWAGNAGASRSETKDTQVSAGNASDGDLGGRELDNARTVAEGQIGRSASGEMRGPLGTVSGRIEAGASGKVETGDNGVQASFEGGIAAELEAVSETARVGNDVVGASAGVEGRLEALIGAEGTIGAYIDDKGITLGGEARAGAFVSAEAAANFEAHFFGVQTNVRAYAEGHAGFLARGEAVVTIGFDGKIKFALGAGLSVGLGFSVGVEFELDASELMERLGLPGLATLLEWIAKFRRDPGAALQEMLEGARDALIQQVEQAVSDAVERVIDTAAENLGRLADEVLGDFNPFSWGAPMEPAAPQPAPASGGDASPVIQVLQGADPPGSGAGASGYSRDMKYNAWSK